MKTPAPNNTTTPQKANPAPESTLRKTPLSGLRSGHLGELATVIDRSPRLQAQLKLAQEIRNSGPVQCQLSLAREVNQKEPDLRAWQDVAEGSLEKKAEQEGVLSEKPSRPAVVSPPGKAAQGVVQRIIREKGGKTYDSKLSLPEGVRENGTLIGQATVADTYLVKNEADLVKRGSGETAPMLTPHRHLIGESHNQSKFTKAIDDWGWGAEKMAESFQTSAVVTDLISEENRNLRGVGVASNPYYQVKYLENLHAFMLAGFAMVIAYLAELKEKSEQASRIAGNVAGNVSVDLNKESFKVAERIMEKNRTQAKDTWNDHIGPHIPSYEKACKERLKTLRGGAGNTAPELLHDLAAAMKDIWPKLAGNFSYIGKQPYNVFDSWSETSKILVTYAKNVDNLLEKAVKVFAEGVKKLAEAEAETLPGSPDTNKGEVTAGWARATSSTDSRDVLEGSSRARELFMTHNINTNLNPPGIVQIGSEHVTNLNGKITAGKYHASYDAFVEDTKR